MFKSLKDYFTWRAFLKALEQVKKIDPKRDLTRYRAAIEVATLAADKLLTGEKREKAKQLLTTLALIGTGR